MRPENAHLAAIVATVKNEPLRTERSYTQVAAELMDDTYMRQMGYNEKAATGNTRPRLFIESVPPVGLEPTLRRF